MIVRPPTPRSRGPRRLRRLLAAALLLPAAAATPAAAEPAGPALTRPTITSVGPHAGWLAGGQKVTIRGSGFRGVTGVLFGGSRGTGLHVVSPTKLTVRTPPGAVAETVPVTVRAAGGATPPSRAARYTYQPNATVQTTGSTSCLVKPDRSGWCWGQNSFQTAGYDTGGEPVLAPHRLPGRWQEINGRDSAFCGVRTDGSGWCWGLATDDYTMTQVAATGSWRTLRASGFVRCGIKTTGSLWCWGSNGDGQIGIGSSDPLVSTPERVGGTTLWSSVSVGTRTVCGITVSGQGRCWGNDEFAAVGNPAVGADATTPFDLGTGWSQLTTSDFTTCGVQDGTAKCWGWNQYGEAGNGAAGSPTYPNVETPTAVVGGHDLTVVDTTPYVSCGIAQDRTGWCFGDGGVGALGAGGATRQSSSPLSVGSTHWSRIDVGGAVCGVDVDAGLWCWGSNTTGTVGDGTGTDRFVPTKLPGKWTSVSVGEFTACGVRTDNSVWCWGRNQYAGPPVVVIGGVGNGTGDNQLTPYRLPGT